MEELEKEAEAPPTYDLSQIRDVDVGEKAPEPKAETGKDTPELDTKPMSIEARIAWALALSIPLLASFLLLFLITCSSSDLRTDFSVVKMDISKSTFDALYNIANDQKDDTDSSVLATTASFGGDMRKRAAEAYMTLGVWGWCTKSADSSK